MKKKEKLGILLIGILQMISALVLLVTLNVQQNPGFNVRFGVSFLPEIPVKLLVGIGSIIISYGYLRLLKWGFWGMLLQSGYFLLACMIQLMFTSTWIPPIGVIIYHIIVIIYTLFHYKDFEVCFKIRKIDNINN